MIFFLFHKLVRERIHDAIFQRIALIPAEWKQTPRTTTMRTNNISRDMRSFIIGIPLISASERYFM